MPWIATCIQCYKYLEPVQDDLQPSNNPTKGFNKILVLSYIIYIYICICTARTKTIQPCIITCIFTACDFITCNDYIVTYSLECNEISKAGACPKHTHTSQRVRTDLNRRANEPQLQLASKRGDACTCSSCQITLASLLTEGSRTAGHCRVSVYIDTVSSVGVLILSIDAEEYIITVLLN